MFLPHERRDGTELQIVRQSLNRHVYGLRDIAIVKIDYRLEFPTRTRDAFHHVAYHLAPREGLYTPDELNDFMTEMAPTFPTNQNQSRVDESGYLIFGSMDFFEIVPIQRSRKLAGTDESPVERTYNRQVRLILYPDETIGRDVLKGRLKWRDCISLGELGGYYQRNLEVAKNCRAICNKQ